MSSKTRLSIVRNRKGNLCPSQMSSMNKLSISNLVKDIFYVWRKLKDTPLLKVKILSLVVKIGIELFCIIYNLQMTISKIKLVSYLLILQYNLTFEKLRNKI